MTGTGTLNEAHAWLEAQVGVTETGGPDGHSGNIVPYWDFIGRPDLQGESWCGALEDAMAKAIGLHMPSMISTHRGAAAFDRQGRFIRDPNGGRPGDMVFFAWSGSKRLEDIDHIEFLVQPNKDGTNTDIGGNTSAVGRSGQAQRNGGMVAKRNRDRAYVVGYGRPDYAPPKPGAPRLIVVKHNPYNRHDSLVRWTQWALGVPVDGVPGKATWTALRAFQARHGIRAPHYPDAATVAALAVITHAS